MSGSKISVIKEVRNLADEIINYDRPVIKQIIKKDDGMSNVRIFLKKLAENDSNFYSINIL